MNPTNWTKLLLGLALVIVVWAMNQIAKGTLVVPAAVGTALAIAKTVLSMLTDGVPSAAARARAMRVLKSGQRAAGVVVLLGAAGGGARLLTACSASQNQKAVPVVADVSGCIIKDVVACATAKPPTPWQTCAEQTALDCGSDVASVGTIWAAHKLAEAREADAGAIVSVVNYP